MLNGKEDNKIIKNENVTKKGKDKQSKILK